MSKVLTFCLVILLLLSLLCYFTASSFNLRAYANNLNGLPDRPALPDWSKVSISFSNADTIGSAFSALGSFFVFVVDCLAYPFKLIGYMFDVVYAFTNGMLEKD